MPHPARRAARLVAAALCLLALAPAVPGHAAPPARPYQQGGTLIVDKINDASTPPGSETCDGSPNNCSLRKAIQIANATTSGDVTILFDTTVFNGANPIQLVKPLDTVSRQGTKIIANNGAVVKITFNTTTTDKETVFRLDADDVVLDGLTIYGATRSNVELFQGANRQTTVKNNVIGVPTQGAACPVPNQTSIGIDVAVDVDGPAPDSTSAVYIYNNRVECHNGASSGTGGIIVSGGRKVFVGVNETNQIAGNFVRTNRNGIGLDENTQSTTVKGNTVITNSRGGIFITSSGAASPNENKIESNLIGTTGTSLGDGNRGSGIEIIDSRDTLIKNNVVAGNKQNGISITGDNSSNTKVESNFIGVASDRQTIIPNGDQNQTDEKLKNGIYIGGSAGAGPSDNIIGGTQASQLNIIGNSAGHGIFIDNSDDNLVLFNDIGLYSVGPLPLPNRGAGIKISGASHGNIIGQQGTAAPLPLAPQANFIWHNTGPGIEINAANDNFIFGNSVRRNAKGVRILNANGTEIYRTLIWENRGAGISEEGSSSTNFWGEVSTSNNAAGGIDKTATAPSPAAPRVTTAQRLSATTYRVSGTSVDDAAVEVFMGMMGDPNEGSKFVGRVTADNNGTWSIIVTIPAASSSAAFLATQTTGSGSSRRTSEFSSLGLPKVYVPLTWKLQR